MSPRADQTRHAYPPGHRRVVLHVDADAFFCQVERLRDPGRFANVNALAVYQHGEVIAVESSAKNLGVKKFHSPEVARKLLQPAGGVLQHVPVTNGQRVTYRPYQEKSKALHKLLMSKEMNDLVLEVLRGVNGVGNSFTDSEKQIVVEKASIDEAFVQLPSGCLLREVAVPVATAIRKLTQETLGLTVSVGVSWNKTFAKFSSQAAKPDGVLVTVGDGVFTDLESTLPSRISLTSLLKRTPVTKISGCGGGGVRKKLNDLGCNFAFEIINFGNATVVSNVLRNNVGLPDARVTQIVQLLYHGKCDDPVVNKGTGNKSIGVHFSLSTTSRRMPQDAIANGVVSAAGGRPGWFDPVCVGEFERLICAIRSLSNDLAERVVDECVEDVETVEGLDVNEECSIHRYPRVLRLEVTCISSGRHGTPHTSSRQSGFPIYSPSFVLGDDISSTAITLLTTCMGNQSAASFVTKLSLFACDIRINRRESFGRKTTPIKNFFELSDHGKSVSDAGAAEGGAPITTRVDAMEGSQGKSKVRTNLFPKEKESENISDASKKRKTLDSSKPLDACALLNALGSGAMHANGVGVAKRARTQWLERQKR